MTRMKLIAGLATTLLIASACGSSVTAIGNSGGSGGGASTTNTSGSSGAGASTGGGGGTGGAGGSTGVQCNPNVVDCNQPAPACPQGQVPSPEGACWGPCVPILDCATEESCDACPTGFCAAYVAWVTEYRCVLPALQCSALHCGCTAPYFCVPPYDGCVDGAQGDDADITCDCPAC